MSRPAAPRVITGLGTKSGSSQSNDEVSLSTGIGQLSRMTDWWQEFTILWHVRYLWPTHGAPSMGIHITSTRAVTMERRKKILICGGGIAGPACAWLLTKYGFSVLVAEKASGFRDGGQNVDVKGAGQQVINRMGLTEQIEARNTQECGQKWLDAAGKVVAVFPKGSFGSLTSDFEILRGDFARVLFDATRSTCQYRFDTAVNGIEEIEDGVRATFVDGSTEEFALLICADGLSSSTRDLALAQETRLRYLGAYMAFFKIARRPEDDLWACSVNGIGGTMIHLRPGGPTATTVLI